MNAPRAWLRRLALALTVVALPAATLHAQIVIGPTLPIAVARFAFDAPPPPKVTLLASDGLPLPDGGINFVPGPVSIPWDRKDLNWWFRCQPTSSAVVSVRWELSKYPFPAAGPFIPSPGFGLTGFALPHDFLVDLNPLAPRPPNWTPKLALDGITGSFKGAVLPPPDLTTPTT